ncbi:MAG TPA: DUF4118 domain-containing protein, partial [Pyrinomonadaceae bacterium]|nr:DUF4118 domain-containing protein [Pyrinomonadaceae bacterium]
HSRINSTTVAFIFLTIILFVATFLGRNPALLVSLVAMLGFNYFFLPLLRTWTISDPQNRVYSRSGAAGHRPFGKFLG